jgi:hypothetical protein
MSLKQVSLYGTRARSHIVVYNSTQQFAYLRVPFRVQEQTRHIFLLTRSRSEVCFHSLVRNLEKSTFPLSRLILLRDIEVLNFVYGFVHTNDMNFRLVPHLASFKVLPGESAGLPEPC